MRFFLPVLAFFVLLPSAAFAACASPTGTAGEIIFNADAAVEQYCDGTNWVSFGKSLTSAPTSVQPPSSGLVGHWKFDDGSGTTATDSAGSSNGTLTNGPVWTTGKVGGALQFDGTDDYVHMGTSLDITMPSTISEWVYPTEYDHKFYSLFAKKDTDNANDMRVELFLCADFGPGCDPNQGSASIETQPGSAVYFTYVPPLNTWSHLTYVFTDTQFDLYVNGTLSESVPWVLWLGTDSSAAITVGGNLAAGNFFKGKIDDVRIYNRALSASEVSSLYGAGAGRSGPVAYWKLDETSGNTVADSAGSYTGTWGYTATNDPVPGVIGNAMYTGWARIINMTGPITEINNASQATLSLWMRRSAVGQEESVGQGGGYESQEFSIAYAGSNVVFTIPDTVVDGNWAKGSYALNDTNWHLLTLVFDGTQTGDANRLKGYVDGAAVSLTYTGTIGSMIGGTTYNFSIANEGASDVAYIDDVRVYNRALSASEVSDLYNTGVREVLSHPVVWWKLDESTGTTAEDSIGTNDGTLTGDSVTWQSTSGKLNGALQFGGTYDYVLNGSATGLPALRSNLTISAWYYLTATPVNWGYVVSLVNQGANATTRLGIDNAGAVSIGKYGASGGIINAAATSSLNAWHLYTYTFDGATNRLYIDGTQVGSSTNLPDNATPDAIWVGNDGFQSDTTQFTGLIDDVRIYDRTLSAAEVSALYSLTDCHGPAGDAGTIIFNTDHSVLQYCDGSEWVAVDNGPSATASYNTTGIAGYWKLDESSGTAATDSSGNNNTGTLTNGPTWTTGKISGATDFDGTDDYINVPASSSLNNLSAMTVIAWVRPDSVDSPARIVTKSTECCMSSLTGGWRFIISDNGSALDKGLDFGVDYSGTNLDVNRNNLLTAGVWQHVAVTWDGSPSASGVVMYVNGQIVSWYDGTDDPTGSRVDDSSTAIGIGGRTSGNPGDWFDGKMDDVRIYNRVLSANEIAALYSNTSPPVGMWLLDDGSGTTATDSAGSNNGTLTNGPVWQPSGGHDGGGAVQFDGVDDFIDLPVVGLPANNAPQTISVWFKYSSAQMAGASLVTLTNSGASSHVSLGFECCVGWMSVVKWGGADLVHYNAVPSANVWHQMLYTFDGTTHSLYLDGEQLSTSTNAPNTGTPNDGAIGQSTYANSFFNGLIDDVRVWDRALSATEVADLYNASGPAMPTPIAEWKMDEGSGTTAADSIGNSDGTLVNGPTWGTGLFGGAVDFPTSNDVITLPSGLAANKTQMTVTAWVNSRTIISTSPQPIYIESNASNCGASIFQLYFWDGNNGIPGTELRLMVDNTQVVSSGETILSDNTWYFVVGVFDSVNDVHKVYINDTEYSNSSAQSAVSSTTVDAAIGNNAGGGGFCSTAPFNGLIDDVRVYDTALTAAQIRSLYRATACTDPTGAPGTMIYNNTHSVLQYCNGTNWVGIGK